MYNIILNSLHASTKGLTGFQYKATTHFIIIIHFSHCSPCICRPSLWTSSGRRPRKLVHRSFICITIRIEKERGNLSFFFFEVKRPTRLQISSPCLLSLITVSERIDIFVIQENVVSKEGLVIKANTFCLTTGLASNVNITSAPKQSLEQASLLIKFIYSHEYALGTHQELPSMFASK